MAGSSFLPHPRIGIDAAQPQRPATCSRRVAVKLPFVVHSKRVAELRRARTSATASPDTHAYNAAHEIDERDPVSPPFQGPLKATLLQLHRCARLTSDSKGAEPGRSTWTRQWMWQRSEWCFSARSAWRCSRVGEPGGAAEDDAGPSPGANHRREVSGDRDGTSRSMAGGSRISPSSDRRAA